MTTARTLLRHRDFRRLWAAETVSQVGTQVTALALPVLAVTLLAATPLQRACSRRWRPRPSC